MKHFGLRIIALAATALFISFKAFSQAKLVQEVSGNGSDWVIPFKKFILPNGLTLLVHEDHSDPIVHVDVTYHVGSARELVGRSGFAHFFEHMMFQGSEHVRDEEHFKIITECGGTLNGTTNLDRTNYFETVPSNYLETVLWLEADRMGWFLDSVTQQKFEIQRATVKNERGQNYDNRPYGLVNEKTVEALYPFGHPYSWTTIGYIEDLNAATLEDLKRFFLRWYGPNNATLTVAGDVNTDEVVKLVEKYFGNIPRGPEVKNMRPMPATLDQDRYISYEDNIRFPMIRMTFPGVEARHKDEAALDILANIIGGGNNSVLYQHFVKTQKAIQANVNSPANELAGEFVITVVAYPGTSLADTEREIREILQDFEKRGITDDDLLRFKAKHEANEIRSLLSVSGKASKLAYYQTFTGNANYLKQDIDRYMAVTKEDVMRVYNTYIRNKPAVILSVVPKGQSELIAKPDNYKRPEVPAGYKNDLREYENLTYNKGKYPFEADYRPLAGTNPVIKLPDYWTAEFDNGIKLIATEYDELPVIAMRISVDGGKLLDGMDKTGLAYLTANLMNEGTKNYTAEQMSLNLELLGSSIDVSASAEGLEINVFSLKKNFDKTLEYLKEIMFSPRFNESDFERLKKQQLESIANQKNQAAVIANNVLNRIMYGDKSIYSIPTIGTEKTVSTITLDDVKKYYEQYFSPSVASVVLVGNIGKKDVLKKLEFLKTWKGEAVKLPAFCKPKGVDKTTLFFVDKPGAAQSEIRVGLPGLAWDATGDYYRAGIMNYPFGGAFNSRLNLNLREKRGYTYGVRSYFNGSKFTGTFGISGGFLAHATDSVIIEILNELTNYKENGVTEQELVFTKNSIGQRDALKYETPIQKAGFMSNIITYNLDKNFVKIQNDILKKLTSFDVNQLAKQLLKPDKLAIVIVGDKAKVYEKLKKLNIPMVEMDYTGEVQNQ
jgi:zinc protease